MTDREFSIDIIRQLQDAGHTALWAGGCVRDSLLGQTPKDYDVATSATPEMVRDLFGHRRTLPIGAAFGVISVLPPGKSAGATSPVEVATFRRDGGYSDGRRPDHVEYTDAREDAARRDFTINGMFFDPLTETVRDYVGGQEDLNAGVVRAIGDPAQRIEEDKLRMLRGVRFAATFDFRLDTDTMAAIQQRADQITVVSGERIGSELRKMLASDGRVMAARLLNASKLLPHLLPDMPRLNAEAVAVTGLNQLLRLVFGTVAESPGHDSATFEAAVVCLLEPAFGNGTDQAASRALASALQKAWVLTNTERATIAWLGCHWKALHQADQHPWPMMQRLLIQEHATAAIDVAAAIAGDSAGLAFCRARLAWPPKKLNPPPLIDGGQLIAAGISPGPLFKQILTRVRDAQLIGEVETTEAALAMIETQMKNH